MSPKPEEQGFAIIKEGEEVLINFCGHGSPSLQQLIETVSKAYPETEFCNVIIRPYILNQKIAGIIVTEQKGIPETILCPTPEQIEEYVNGGMKINTIKNHLLTCSKCNETKEKLKI